MGFLASLLLHTSEGPPSSATINGSVSGLSATPLPPIPTLSVAVSYHEVVPVAVGVGRGGGSTDYVSDGYGELETAVVRIDEMR